MNTKLLLILLIGTAASSCMGPLPDGGNPFIYGSFGYPPPSDTARPYSEPRTYNIKRASQPVSVSAGPVTVSIPSAAGTQATARDTVPEGSYLRGQVEERTASTLRHREGAETLQKASNTGQEDYEVTRRMETAAAEALRISMAHRDDLRDAYNNALKGTSAEN